MNYEACSSHRIRPKPVPIFGSAVEALLAFWRATLPLLAAAWRWAVGGRRRQGLSLFGAQA